MNQYLKLHLKKTLGLSNTELAKVSTTAEPLDQYLRETDAGEVGGLIFSIDELLDFNERNNARHIRSLQKQVGGAELIKELQDAHAKLRLAMDGEICDIDVTGQCELHSRTMTVTMLTED